MPLCTTRQRAMTRDFVRKTSVLLKSSFLLARHSALPSHRVIVRSVIFSRFAGKRYAFGQRTIEVD